MRAVILGGTFNPVHYGHLFIAEEARNAFGYDAVILVPANLPVHKNPSPILPGRHRLEMLRLAVEGIERFRVDSCEIERGGQSYSIDTAVELALRHRIDGKPGFIIGDDLIGGFTTWKEAERLADTVDLIVARRGLPEPLKFDYPHKVVENTILPISSSEIRRRLGEGKTARFLLPEAVLRYITENHLYG
jgi:nicotinate-nucleotide adenylyltransferase